MSLGAQKEHRAEAKRVSDIQFKIKRAEKNLVQFFQEVKKIMDRADEENIIPDLPATLQQARFCEKSQQLLRFLYVCFDASVRNGNDISVNAHMNVGNIRVSKNDFVAFLRFYTKNLSET